ncbi:MAG TPA: alpha/beta hydrolase family protein [Pyrinomonadaceae bacterium]|nr:alpha/beta hydrolase family protein [Pyrinomonadaceae bacterium]
MKKLARALLLILLLSFVAYGQDAITTSVETVQFKSKLVGATLPYSVVLPSTYKIAGHEKLRYPVLYLLHGLAGHYDNWLSKTKLKDYAAAYQMIIVTPEGNDGWYTDSATVPTDKYESYIMQELIPDVESRYRTIREREGRGIAGLSMGGYGALKFGVKYPEKFIFAASISGALDPTVRSDANPRNIWSFLRPSVMQTFGAPDNPVRAANDLQKLIRDLQTQQIPSLPFFYLDCGTEDSFITTNREMSAILLERKIRHEFRELPGTHSWAYWDSQVQEVLRLAARKMSSATMQTNPRMRNVTIY